jgi:hypothetical protein
VLFLIALQETAAKAKSCGGPQLLVSLGGMAKADSDHAQQHRGDKAKCKSRGSHLPIRSQSHGLPPGSWSVRAALSEARAMPLTFALGQGDFDLSKIALPETLSLSSSYRIAQDKLVLRRKNAFLGGMRSR